MNDKARIEQLEAALREIETAPVRFDDGSLGKIDVPYGRGIIKGLESSAEIARTALFNLCEDEGCPNAGTPHVCINRQEYDDVYPGFRGNNEA